MQHRGAREQDHVVDMAARDNVTFLNHVTAKIIVRNFHCLSRQIRGYYRDMIHLHKFISFVNVQRNPLEASHRALRNAVFV